MVRTEQVAIEKHTEGESLSVLCDRLSPRLTLPARGNSRRITTMFRPANISVINRRRSSSIATRSHPPKGK